MNVKLFIATPAFDGKVHVPYAIALAETVLLLAKNHIQVELRINTSGSLLCAERNRLVKAFIESDCTHMLCIDSDLGWHAQSVIDLLKKDCEFIAGVYPSRGIEKAFTFRPIFEENGSVVNDPVKNLLKMQAIPAGFMLIKRSVLEKMITCRPDLEFIPKDPNSPSGHALFNTEIYQGEFWGEDYIFCLRAQDAGVDIWVDPMLQFNHAGIVGALVETLTNEKPAEMLN